ncbi:5-(carboxyamino)imidazole ribonucleotide mutase [Alphaproteobacteria bacterium]|nr:5-(carboxyamino)imidazole ribonucleotide mutase [Alphaproteobacteria bacterium]
MINNITPPIVALIMGSQTDWETMKFSKEILSSLKISHTVKIISAHRTPDRMTNFAKQAEQDGLQIIIAGAGGAAHLPGMVASHTNIPVIGVPIESTALKGIDSLLSIVQMPGGIPVATMSIGKAGAINAAIYAAKIISLSSDIIKQNLDEWIKNQTNNIPESPF